MKTLGGETGEAEGQLVPELQMPQRRSKVLSAWWARVCGVQGPADELAASPRESPLAHREFSPLVPASLFWSVSALVFKVHRVSGGFPHLDVRV